MHAGPGTYALVLRSEARRSLQIGRWGRLELQPGYYVYIGSACGPGGVRARVSRHCRKSKPRHWHIDYLREALDVVCVWSHYSEVHHEHHWASTVAGMRGATAVKGFGCSDCDCESHLFHFPFRPRRSRFADLVDLPIDTGSCGEPSASDSGGETDATRESPGAP